ncbi:MAG: NUDIX hydrolase [Actinomycetia bacterium]|nr:NUDIX hydrolase [Actinomycetes bacterium]
MAETLDPPEPENPPEPRPSSTVVMLRDGTAGMEVLLVRRNPSIAFYGGAWVFPGGKVDPEDLDGDGVISGAELEIAARRAAVREVAEEAGLTIAESDLAQWSHWTTPVIRPKRFSTWFYVCEGDDSEVEVDGGEIHDHDWVTAVEAFRRFEAREIELGPPTWLTIRSVAAHGDVASVLAHARATEPAVFAPRVVLDGNGTPVSIYNEDAAHPTRHLAAPGARHRLLMQPGAFVYERSGF